MLSFAMCRRVEVERMVLFLSFVGGPSEDGEEDIAAIQL